MKKLKRNLFFSLLIFVVLLLSACGSSGSVKPSPKYYTLTVEKIGEGEVIPAVGSHEMEKETIANLKATAASGWQFVSWEGEVANTASAETTVYMDGDKTVKAVFEELEPNLEYQTLTVEKIGEGEVIPAVGSHEMEKETTANLKATAASGWQFVNWEGEVANTASAETTVYMDSDKTVSAVFEEIINEVPGTVNSNNSTVNLKGDLFYGQKLNQDLVLDNDLDISFVRVDLNIVLQDYQQNPVDDGEYLISISSDLDGNILVDQKISVSDGTASVNFNLLTEGNHRLTVIVDSVAIITDFLVNVQSSDLYFAGGTLDLNGYELNINGDFYQESGEVLINNGILTVNGDYRLQSKTESGDFEKGSGVLKMINRADLVSVFGDFIVQSSSSHTDHLIDGTLEIKGDFEQIGNNAAYGNYSRYNFNASGNHTVVFSGDRRQNISFESTQSGFALINIANSDLDFLTLVKGGTLSSNAELDNSLIYGFTDNLDLNGKKLVINGDFIQTGAAVVDFNSGELSVKENLIQEAGSFNITSGHLSVGGDYRLQNQEIIDGQTIYSNSSAFLIMNDFNDYVEVDGDFIMQSTKDHSEHLTAGILEVKGDFSQIGNSAAYGNYSRYNFNASASHKVIFSGNSRQDISFENANSSGFALADLDNSDLKFLTAVRGWKLEKNSVIDNSIPYGFAGEFDLNGRKLTINGDFVETVDGTLDLNGGKLIIKGDFYQPTGILKVNRALVMIEGDYRLQTTAFERGNGKLIMLEEEDYILVKGIFATHSTSSHENNLKDGVLEVKGDFKQIGNSAAYGNYSRSNFEATENHKVVLSGTKQQSINFEGLRQSKFAILTAVNGDNNRVVFNQDINFDRRSDATLNNSYLKLNQGSSIQLLADFMMENSNQHYWSSRDTDIATVTNSGLIGGVKEGYTAVKITSSTDLSIFIYSFVEVD